MKNIILFLFFILPILGCAQYPTTGNKQRLGWQTTGDGLVYRDAGYPSYTPNSRNNAYVYMDTVAKRYYHFSNGAWYDLSDEKYIHRQDQSVLALAVRDSLTTYDRLFIAMEITSAGASDRGVQLPVTAIDSSYAGRVVRVSSLDSSGTYNVFVSSSSPDGLLVDGALATTYYLAADETAEFQLYVFDTIYQWRLVHTSEIPASIGGSGTPGTLAKFATSITITDAAITETATRLATSLPFRLANIPTVSLPASPLAGDVLYNPTTGNFTGYFASSWRPLSLWEINGNNIGYSLGNVSVGSTSTFTRKFNVFDDLGLAGTPFQYYPVAKFARSSSGFGVEIGYGTRGFSSPGIEVAGSIQAVGSADARLMLGVQNRPSSLYINSAGGVSLGTGADINGHNLANVYFNLPLAFTTSSTIAASTASPTIYASNGISNPLSGGASMGDLVLQSRSISGQNKAIGFVTGFIPITRMSIDDNRTIISNELRLSTLTPAPTRILGADTDGDVGQVTLGTGLSLTTGTLSVIGVDTHFGANDLTWTGNRTHNAVNYSTTLQNAGDWTMEGSGNRIFRNTSIEGFTSFIRNAGVDLSNGDGIHTINFVGRRSGVENSMARIRAVYNGDGTNRYGILELGVGENTGFGNANLRLISFGMEKYLIAGDGLAAYVESDFDAVNMFTSGGIGLNTLGIDNSNKESIALFEDNKNIIFGGYGAGSKTIMGDSVAYILGVTPSGRMGEVTGITKESYTNQTSTSSPITISLGDNLINQGGTQATFTFNLPSSPTDGTICRLVFINAVTICSVGGGTILGASVTTATAGDVLEYKYYTSGTTWVRIQ